MRPDRVVVVAPEGQLSPRIFQTVEYLLVQQLVPEAAVEAFHERILLRFAWIDVMLRHGVLVCPSQDRPTGEFGRIVTDNTTGLAINPDQGAELTGNPFAREAGIHN